MTILYGFNKHRGDHEYRSSSVSDHRGSACGGECHRRRSGARAAADLRAAEVAVADTVRSATADVELAALRDLLIGEPLEELQRFLTSVVGVPGEVVSLLVSKVEGVPLLLDTVRSVPPRLALGYAVTYTNSIYYDLVSTVLAPLNVPPVLSEWDVIDGIVLTLGDILYDVLTAPLLPVGLVASALLADDPVQAVWSFAASLALTPLSWAIPAVVVLTNVLPKPFGGVPDSSLPAEQQGLIFSSFVKLYLDVYDLITPPAMLAVAADAGAPVETAVAEFGPSNVDSIPEASGVTVTLDSTGYENADGSAHFEQLNVDGTAVDPEAAITNLTNGGTGDPPENQSGNQPQVNGGENVTPNGGTDLTDGNMAQPGGVGGEEGNAGQGGDPATVTEPADPADGENTADPAADPGDGSGDGENGDGENGEG
jgi:hypothetical protein